MNNYKTFSLPCILFFIIILFTYSEIFFPTLILATNTKTQTTPKPQNKAQATTNNKNVKNNEPNYSKTLERILAKLDALKKEIDDIKIILNKKNSTNNPDEEGLPTKDKISYDTALSLLKSQNYAEAEIQFSEFLTNFPQSPYQKNALFWYAETFYQRKIYNKAAMNFLKSYQRFPKGEKAADSLLKGALSFGYLKKHKDACDLLEKLESEFPDREETSKKRSIEAKNKFGCKF